MVERNRYIPARKEVGITPSVEEQGRIIARAREQIVQLSIRNPNIVQRREDIARDKKMLSLAIFASKREAINSRHDIRHGAEFRLLAPFIGGVVEGETGFPVNRDVLRLGMLHDTQRLNDTRESLGDQIQRHGEKIAELLPFIMPEGAFSQSTVDYAAELMRVHDIKETPEKFAGDPTAEVFIGTDRLLLGRILHAKESLFVTLAKPRINSRRNKYHTQHFDMGRFKDIADAIFLLSINDINAQVKGGIMNPDQFDAVVRAGEALGMIV